MGNDFTAVSQALKNAASILIVTHVKPDGDALGSAFALLEILQTAGKKAELLLPGPLPEKYLGMISRPFLTRLPEEGADFDVLCVLDCARAARADGAEPEKFAGEVINIDHHPDNDMQRHTGVVDGTAAATAELIYELAMSDAAWKITPAAADWLLLGLVTDSGSFRFSNTTAAALRAAADLLDAGADLEKVINAAFFSKSESQQLFEAELVTKFVKKAFDGRLVYAMVPFSLFRKYDFSLKDGESVIELLRERSGCVIAVLCCENAAGEIKVSLRSRDRRFPVGPIARRLGGGGHEMAAGATLSGTDMAAVEQKIMAETAAAFRE